MSAIELMDLLDNGGEPQGFFAEGHIDRHDFASACLVRGAWCGMEPSDWTGAHEDVQHVWWRIGGPTGALDYEFLAVPPTHPEAKPYTVWGWDGITVRTDSEAAPARAEGAGAEEPSRG